MSITHGCSNAGNKKALDEAGLPADTLVVFQPDWEELPSGEIDLSFLLDKPAGKEGFLKISDGHFYTPRGERFRIWGVNLTGGSCYPDKTLAPRVAQLLASLGINAVRFHFLDSDWGAESSVFMADTNTTRALDPGQLDKLDYFVAELKKAGIYSNFNLNVGRNFREGDEVPYHEYLGLAKAVTLFDDRIIALQKEYAWQLLTHENPYTGNAYRNEPALAFVEIVNENSLVEAWFRGHLEGTHNTTQTSTWIDIPEYYARELTKKYNDWLRENASPGLIASLRKEAGTGADEPVPRLNAEEFQGASTERFGIEARFIIETEGKFYSGMYRFLKDSVQVNQWVAANSDHNHWKSGYALLSNTSKLDFVDGHVYWQHPRYYRDEQTGKNTFSIENTPMVNDPWHSTVAQLARSAVEGKPYTVSETNHPYPNEYASEGIPVLGAYALLQDWDGIYFYTFEHDDPSRWKVKTPRYFDIMHDPAKLSNLAAAGLMFHRADLTPAATMVFRNYTPVDLVEGIRSDAAPMPFFTPGLAPATPLVYRTRIRSFEGGANEFPALNDTGQVISETGQLTWYYGNADEPGTNKVGSTEPVAKEPRAKEPGEKKSGENEITGIGSKTDGLVVIDAPATQGLIGFSEKMKEVRTRNLLAALQNRFATLLLTSMDGNTIETSRKLLLSATSTSILSNAVWNDTRTSLEAWGEMPFMIEPVVGKITLSGLKNTRGVTITPLDASGKRLASLLVVKEGKNAISFMAGTQPATWYLVEK
ncbi:MAG: hypothetical protein P1P82_03365 [Bacteroidales bacterium]|nr:hypothetical protein [Bacteroidales bacterium]MDT8431996.1 hypothetical protein [Bacteroidales bacterium]